MVADTTRYFRTGTRPGLSAGLRIFCACSSLVTVCCRPASMLPQEHAGVFVSASGIVLALQSGGTAMIAVPEGRGECPVEEGVCWFKVTPGSPGEYAVTAVPGHPLQGATLRVSGHGARLDPPVGSCPASSGLGLLRKPPPPVGRN